MALNVMKFTPNIYIYMFIYYWTNKFLLFLLFSHNVGIILENIMFLLIKDLKSEFHKILTMWGVTGGTYIGIKVF